MTIPERGIWLLLWQLEDRVTQQQSGNSISLKTQHISDLSYAYYN